MTVESFLPSENALYFTSAATPGCVWLWQEDEGENAQAMRWMGPWMDLGAMNAIKSDFCVYLSPECTEDAAIRIGIETERHCRIRTLQLKAGDSGRIRRLRFPGRGRRFRLIVESDEGPVWHLPGGVQLEAENDAD